MRKILYLSILMSTMLACSKDRFEANVQDVAFSANKTSVKVGEELVFSIGSGADAVSVYTGDAGKDFQQSRIVLVEQKGLSEEQLRTNLYAERLPELNAFLTRIPEISSIPADVKFTGAEMNLYEGKLVPWDYSNVTNSRYLRLKLADGKPQTLSFNANKTVLPVMQGFTTATLQSKGALNTVPNNVFGPSCAFPDGFNAQSQSGVGIKVGLQLVIDGKESPITYFSLTVRELLDNLGLDISATFNAWKTANPSLKAANGIDEVRLIFNADDPTKTDDDGDLLSYIGNVYIQELRLGSPDNTIKAFSTGVTVPFVFTGTTQNLRYKYSKAGTYLATMVATYIGRKKYSGDGYITDRANEILASEYDIQRRTKTIEIKVE